VTDGVSIGGIKNWPVKKRLAHRAS
jgi:hypothetical protein